MLSACRKLLIDGLHAKATLMMNKRDSAVDHCSRHRQHAHGDDDEPIGDGGSFRSHAPQMACCFACILQSGGGGGLSAQIGALQQSWRANAPADFARVKFCAGAVAVRYAHLAAIATNISSEGGKCVFVGLSKSPGRTPYLFSGRQARGGATFPPLSQTTMILRFLRSKSTLFCPCKPPHAPATAPASPVRTLNHM